MIRITVSREPQAVHRSRSVRVCTGAISAQCAGPVFGHSWLF
jgi:hypothetical protein